MKRWNIGTKTKNNIAPEDVYANSLDMNELGEIARGSINTKR